MIAEKSWACTCDAPEPPGGWQGAPHSCLIHDYEAAPCEVCGGTGKVERMCECCNWLPTTKCRRCGNCGVVTAPCPECRGGEYDGE